MSVKEQFENIMAEVKQRMIETDLKFVKIKEDFKNSLQKFIEDKESLSVKKSPKLLETSLAFSPVNINLRTSILKKNFQKKVLFQGNSLKPEKVKKAELMYNRLREIYPPLQTPQFKLPKEEYNQLQSLSIALQQQCLMLQETPAHK